jgi:hypothetical protein
LGKSTVNSTLKRRQSFALSIRANQKVAQSKVSGIPKFKKIARSATIYTKIEPTEEEELVSDDD